MLSVKGLVRNMKKQSKIYVAGHTGMIGSAIRRKLEKEGYNNLILRSHQELDLTRQQDVEDFFFQEKPEYVFLAAAKVGGIHANEIAIADFLRINLQIELNVLESSYKNMVKKLCYIGSGCIYPDNSRQPIKEEYLLSGPFEKKNEGYGIAKMVGVKMCEYYNRQYGANFISVALCNAYGPGDNYNLESANVVPALIRKFHEAKIQNKKSVILWGTGKAMRSFLYADDIADACCFLMENYKSEYCINIAADVGMTIRELGEIIKKIVDFNGKVVFDSTYPDGAAKILLDPSRLYAMGWNPLFSLEEGLTKTYEDYLNNKNIRK